MDELLHQRTLRDESGKTRPQDHVRENGQNIIYPTGGREGGRGGGGKEGGREGGRERKREGRREGVKEGEREENETT